MADHRQTINDIVESTVARTPEYQAEEVARTTGERYVRMAVAADVYQDAITRGLTVDGWLAVSEAYNHWLRWQSALQDVRKLNPGS